MSKPENQRYEDISESTSVKPIIRRGKLLLHVKKVKKAKIRGKYREIEHSEDFVEPESLGYKKKVQIEVLEVREGTSEATLSKIRRYFLHTIEIAINRTKRAKYAYLKLVRPDKAVFINFIPNYCYSVDLTDTSNDFFSISLIKSRRISAKKAGELLEKGYRPYGRFGSTLIPKA